MDALTPSPKNSQVTLVSALESSKAGSVTEERRKIQAAKDFESLLIGKLVDSMKETVGESSLGDDAGAGQIQAMFWSHLSSAMSDEGGVGLWKDIYTNIYGKAPGGQDGSPSAQKLDRTI